MDVLELVQRLATALAIGLVIGLERGWRAREEAEGERAAGLRTHALSGLLGGVWGAIAVRSGDAGSLALALAFATFTAAVAAFRYREAVADRTYGATTVVASMLSFALGALAVVGDMQVAAAAGVVTAGILALKSQLHGWLRRLTWSELRSALVLLAMTVILLPLLPNETIDRWGSINPFELWLMTIMIAAISFVGYVALKYAGDRKGIVVTAVAGGLTSSTAVTITLSELVREHPHHRDPLVAGILIACATMMIRVLAIVAVLHWPLISSLGPPIGLATATFLAVALIMLQGAPEGGKDGKTIAVNNPFELATVLKFGALLTVVTVLAKMASVYAGSAGVYALAFISGIVDVDAVALSMSRFGVAMVGLDVAARAILLVVAVNTVSKAFLGWFAGGAETGRRLALASAAALAAGAFGYWLTRLAVTS